MESPYLFNIKTDPKEEHDILVTNTWVGGPILGLVHAFRESMKQYPNTLPGAEGPE